MRKDRREREPLDKLRRRRIVRLSQRRFSFFFVSLSLIVRKGLQQMDPGTKVYRVVFSLLLSLQRLRKGKKKKECSQQCCQRTRSSFAPMSTIIAKRLTKKMQRISSLFSASLKKKPTLQQLTRMLCCSGKKNPKMLQSRSWESY